MADLDLFRDFRRSVAGPTDDAQRRAAARLASAMEQEHGRGTRIPRLVRERPGRTVLAFAALVGAATAALFVSSPWKASPGFLERAEAALTPPAGTVVHMRWQETRSSTDATCKVTFAPSDMWIDVVPPYRYRGIVSELPDPTDPSPCVQGPTIEGGGTLDPKPVRGYLGPMDPTATYRKALENGMARDEGQTEIDGQIVEHIRVDDPNACPLAPDCEPIDVYVDPTTFHPVLMDNPNGRAPDGSRFRSVVRYLTYEYLPGTAANRALADIRAEHPARGSRTDG